MSLMTNFKVYLDKQTRWNVKDSTTGIVTKFWDKRDAEDFIDLQENVHPKAKGKHVQTQKRKA